MTKGGRVARQKREAEGDPAHRFGAVVPLWVRVAVLVVALSVAAYTLFFANRFSAQDSLKAGIAHGVRYEAELEAARAAAAFAGVDASLASGAESLARRPDRPMDSTELALKAANGRAVAVALASGEEVSAVAGHADQAPWREIAARAAKVPGAWTETDGGVLYIARPAGAGGRRLIAALPLPQPKAPSAGLAILAGADGRILAASDPALTGANLNRLGLSAQQVTDAARTGATFDGKTSAGTAFTAAAVASGDGSVIAISAAPAAATGISLAAILNLLPLLAPMALGVLLVLLVWLQARRAESARKAYVDTERRFRSAVEAARCGVWEWDLGENHVYVSDLMGAMLGWSAGGVVPGDDVLARVAPDHRDRVLQALKSAAMYGAFDVSFRVPHVDARSTWIDARGQALGDRDGEFNRIVGVALDVTDERTAQARAQAAERRLKDAIESVSEAFALWDRRDRLLLSNQNFRLWFGIDARALKPGAPREMVLKIARLAIARETEAGEETGGAREAELNDGRWLQISERRTADGGTVLTAADITAIKRQEAARAKNEVELQKTVAQLERSQDELAILARKYEIEKTRAEAANRAKSEFLANMSHELRTPLNAINGFSEIMVGELYGPLGDRRYKEYASDILMSGQHLLALINDILDMAKIEAGKLNLKFEPISVEEVAEDAIRLMRNRADQAGLALTAELADAPEVEADYRAVKQVLLNLISNAVKFTPRGGAVIVRAIALGSELELSVRDNGIGISREDLDRLARPFEQVETQHAKTQQGTGLGLALTKSLIEMHGGRLAIESEPGRGTTVKVILPLRHGQDAGTAFAA